MEPKEKAKELFSKYNSICHSTSPKRQKERTIGCAKIAVDEIIDNCMETIPICIPSSELVGSPDWWEKVKNEFDKL